jgi:hypothetical protein
MVNLVTRLSQMTPAELERNTKEALEWFRRVIGSMTVNERQRDEIREGYSYKPKPLIGGMYTFSYKAKWANVLPYYDRFPLTIPFQFTRDGFYGINLHYIHPMRRVELLTELLRYARDYDGGDDVDTRIQMSYQLIKKSARLKWARPCIKRYLTTEIQSQIKEVPYDDWDIVSLLPTYKFTNKVNANTVYKDSRIKVESY